MCDGIKSCPKKYWMDIFHIHQFFVIIVMLVWKDKKRRKRGRGWPFLKLIIKCLCKHGPCLLPLSVIGIPLGNWWQKKVGLKYFEETCLKSMNDSNRHSRLGRSYDIKSISSMNGRNIFEVLMTTRLKIYSG